MVCAVCPAVYGRSCCPFGNDVDAACYCYLLTIVYCHTFETGPSGPFLIFDLRKRGY